MKVEEVIMLRLVTDETNVKFITPDHKEYGFFNWYHFPVIDRYDLPVLGFEYKVEQNSIFIYLA